MTQSPSRSFAFCSSNSASDRTPESRNSANFFNSSASEDEAAAAAAAAGAGAGAGEDSRSEIAASIAFRTAAKSPSTSFRNPSRSQHRAQQARGRHGRADSPAIPLSLARPFRRCPEQSPVSPRPTDRGRACLQATHLFRQSDTSGHLLLRREPQRVQDRGWRIGRPCAHRSLANG